MSALVDLAGWGRYLPRLFKSQPPFYQLYSLLSLNVMPTLRFQLREPLNRNPNLVQMQHFFQLNIDVPAQTPFYVGWGGSVFQGVEQKMKVAMK